MSSTVIHSNTQLGTCLMPYPQESRIAPEKCMQHVDGIREWMNDDVVPFAVM